MRKSMEAVASASRGEPRLAACQQGQQSEKTGHEARVSEDTLTSPTPCPAQPL